MDEMAHLLNLDPMEFRLRNYTEQGPRKNRPWSSKFLKECYQLGAERIGWNKRQLKPGTPARRRVAGGLRHGRGHLRGAPRLLQSQRPAAAQRHGAAAKRRHRHWPRHGHGHDPDCGRHAGAGRPRKSGLSWGNSHFAPAPTQGGSAIVNTVGPAVQDACLALKEKLRTMAAASNAAFASATKEDVVFADGHLTLNGNPAARATYADLLKQTDGGFVTVESKPDGEATRSTPCTRFRCTLPRCGCMSLTGRSAGEQAGILRRCRHHRERKNGRQPDEGRRRGRHRHGPDGSTPSSTTGLAATSPRTSPTTTCPCTPTRRTCRWRS